jgi:hypothetical protein
VPTGLSEESHALVAKGTCSQQVHITRTGGNGVETCVTLPTQHEPGGTGATLPNECRCATVGVLGNSAPLKDVGRDMEAAVDGPTDSWRATPECMRGRASVSQMAPTSPGSDMFSWFTAR